MALQRWKPHKVHCLEGANQSRPRIDPSIDIYIYIYVYICVDNGRSSINFIFPLPVGPHKAVAEVSKIGNL